MRTADAEVDFEKIWIFLENCRHYDEINIAIANAPDDWDTCSFIISGWKDGKNKFMALQFDKKETTAIRDALTKVLEDMPHLTSGCTTDPPSATDERAKNINPAGR